MAADPTYLPKIQHRDGGDTLVVASGGVLDIETGGALTVAGIDVTAEVLALDGQLATAAEINRAADVSTRIVTILATGAITEVDHEGKTCLLADVGGDTAVTLTLPAATGGGGRYRFVVDVVNTSGYVIKAVAGADVFLGSILGNDGGGVTTPLIWRAGATDDTLTLNGTTTGGVFRGNWVEFEDISATGWAVRGVVDQSGTEATPFSDTVA